MPMVEIPFVGAAYKSASLNIDCQRCVNLFPELGGPNSKTVMALRGTPGMLLFVVLGYSGSVGRGLFATSTNRLFGVVGSTLVEITALGVVTARGTIASSYGKVSMADNGLQLMLVDGNKGYTLTLATNVFAEIVDVDFPAGAPVVDYQDGYFIVPKPNTSQFYISTLRDGSTWDALDFGDAEGSPDLLKRPIVNGRDVWLLGENSTEVFWDSGNPDFPFERIQGAFMEVGIAAIFSAAKMQGSVFWLGGSKEGFGIVFQSRGFQAVRISTHALEEEFLTYTTLDDAEGFCYQQEGHWFYQLTFPTASRTWVYDMTTSMWHERAYRDPTSGDLGRHRATGHAFFNGRNLVMDYANDRIYELSPTTYTDNGDAILRIRTAPHIGDRRQRLAFRRLDLDLETGVGLSTGQGSDPQIMLQWSSDNGHTWSNELWRSMGRIGEYKKRVVWYRLGMARDRVFRVMISDPVKVVLLAAFAEVEGEE